MKLAIFVGCILLGMYLKKRFGNGIAPEKR